MKKFFYFLLGTLVILAGGVALIPFLVDVNEFKPKIEQLMEEKTGRKLKMEGEISLSVFPDIALEANGVTLGNPTEFKEGDFAKFETLVVDVKLKPLLEKRLEVEEISLVKPVINLIKHKDGKTNWDFKTEKEDKDKNKEEDIKAKLEKFGIKQFSIKEGILNYEDQMSGKKISISELDVALDESDSGATANIALLWNGQKVNLDAKTGSIFEIVEKGAKGIPIEVKLESKFLKLNYNGKSLDKEDPEFTGKLDISTPSVNKLLRWLKPEAQENSSLDKAFSLVCDSNLSLNHFECKGLELVMGDFKTKGNIFAKYPDREKPYIQADLKTGILQLDSWLKSDQEKEIEASKDRSSPKDDSWKDGEVNIAAINDLNANIKFHADGINVKGIKIGSTLAKVNIRDNVGKAELEEVKLYDGVVNGIVELNQKSNTPTFKQSLKVDNVALGKLLKDWRGKDRFAGTMDSQHQTSGFGKTWRSLIANLSGTGKINLRDGYVRGINLAEIARSFTAPMEGKDSDSVKTDFTEAGASYIINKGVLRNDDLAAKSPFLNVTGSGTVDLVQEKMNYLLEPALVATIEGQGRTKDTNGQIVVPVRIQGSIYDPSIRIEVGQKMLGDLLSDPSKAKETLKGYGDTLKGFGKQLLGGGSKAPVEGEAASPSDGAPSQETETKEAPKEPAQDNPVDQILKMF